MRRVIGMILLLGLAWSGPVLAAGPDVGTRIVGPDRQDAVQAEWPSMTLVNGDGVWLCGGSVIAARWVLSAGHCRYSNTGSPLTTFPLYPGAYTRAALPGVVVADSVRVHPDYVWSGGGSPWDFMLLRTPSTMAVPAMALQAPSDDAAVAAMRTATPGTGPLDGRIAGWGRMTNGGSTATILQHADGGIPMLTDGACTTAWGGSYDSRSMICAGGEPTAPTTPDSANDTCGGDSGGPLAADTGGRRVLVGVTSWGRNCGDPQFPGVYAKVSAVRDWICDTVTSPTSITATAGADSADVAWTPDTTTCAWRNPSVVVTASPGGASATVPLSSGGARLSGLAPGTTYTISARVSSSAGATPPAATASVSLAAAPAPAPAPAPVPTPAIAACSKTFYQQDRRTWRNRKAPNGTNAVRVVSRLRIYEDPEPWCRARLTFILRNKKTGARLAQLPGSTLGFRKLTGKDFSAPVVGWPTEREFRFAGSDTTGLGRRDARLVLVSFLKRTPSMPAQSNIELLVVRRIPTDPAQAQAASNPLFAQKNAFGTAVGWATVS